MTTEFISRIIWAVDPFGTEAPLLGSSLRAVTDLAKATGAAIEPVYVYEESVQGWAPPPAFGGSDESLAARVSEAASASLAKALRKLRARPPRLLPLRVLKVPYSGTGARAQALVEHAKTGAPSMIVAGSHARKGVARWVLGSFAESLMLRSDVPLIVVNPKCKLRNLPLKHVLFATDFSEASHQAFGEAVALARALKARMTVLHVHMLDPFILGGVGFVDAGAYRQAFADLESDRRGEAETWAAEARAMGVRTTAIVDSRTQGSAAEVILKRAARDPGIIAMGGRSGAVGAVLAGSVTRQVARGAELPVWVIHPRPAGRAGARKPAEKPEDGSSRHLSATLI